MGDLLQQGKIRYWGVSNFRGWRIAELCNLAERLGVAKPVVSQPLYNIVNRQAEPEQLTAAAYHGLGVVPFSPLARGVLSGKYAPGAEPAAGSAAARQDKRIMEVEWRQESLAIAQKIQTYAQAKGVGIVEFAIAWVLNNQLVSSAIAGPRTEAQWDTYAGALEVKITAEDEAFIDSLVTPGMPRRPGSTMWRISSPGAWLAHRRWARAAPLQSLSLGRWQGSTPRLALPQVFLGPGRQRQRRLLLDNAPPDQREVLAVEHRAHAIA